MAGKAPGKSYRKGISLVEITEMFSDDDTAREWFETIRWPNGPFCPRCGTTNVQTGVPHKSQTHRCRECPQQLFSLKTGTVMQGSKLGYRAWGIALYLATTNLKGVSSMKLHRDLGINQKSAWHLAHRLRKSFETDPKLFAGPVEADECFVGGLEKNKPAHKKLHAGRGPVGKSVVAGAKDRDTGQVSAQVVEDTSQASLQPFVVERTEPGAEVFTDEHGAYQGIPGVRHQAVKHSIGEWVDGQAHVNGVESFWSMLKRGYHGTYHHISLSTCRDMSTSSLAGTMFGRSTRLTRWRTWCAECSASSSATETSWRESGRIRD